LAIVGSLAAGPALGWLFMRLTRNVQDVPTSIILQFIGTFGVWILADRIGLSGVLTMVCYAVFVARSAPERTPARIRLPSYAVWETVVFVLNVLAFAFIGLQIRPILSALDPAERARYLYVAAAVLITVIVVRLAWVMTQNAFFRWQVRRFGFHPPRPTLRPTVRSGLIIGWSGMRGIVSLAAALALPPTAAGGPFPYRDLIVVTAFSVVLGTLVIQGLTLRPLIEALDLRDDDPVGKEIEAARDQALRAALASCADDRSPAAEAVRQEFAAHLKPESPATGSDGREPSHDAIHQRAMTAARKVILEMRSSDDIGDDAFHKLEMELDWLEMGSGGQHDEPGGGSD
jgi:CPA1 family monovalent cation:H+ antiporter